MDPCAAMQATALHDVPCDVPCAMLCDVPCAVMHCKPRRAAYTVARLRMIVTKEVLLKSFGRPGALLYLGNMAACAVFLCGIADEG